MSDGTGLLGALVLDGKGGARAVDWAGVRSWKKGDGPLWVHLDRAVDAARDWLTEEAGLDAVAGEALLAQETRPRALVFGDGAVVILRGVNLNPGAEPDDMISVRVWVEADRVISLRLSRLMAVQDVRDELDAGHGPRRTGQVILALATSLADRLMPVLSNLDDIIDEMEEAVVEQPTQDLRRQLGEMRRQAIRLRRHIAPQRDAISNLQSAPVSWLDDRARARLRELGDRVTRYIEDLDALRERAAVVQEELTSRLAEQMNRTMYVLSLVAGIFLPLGLLTGLLGINVGGMPGVESEWAFWIVSGLLVVLAVVVAWLLRRMRLF